MTSATRTQHKLTAEEFARLCADGKLRELVRGEVVDKMPVNLSHGSLAQWIGTLLNNYQAQLRQYLGEVVTETGFVIRHPDADSVRAPDVAFIRKERLPEPRPNAFPELAPDLAVEIVSPSDSYADILEKVDELLQAGTVAVWVVDPKRRSVEVYRRDAPTLRLHEDDMLTCEELLPGFQLPLKTLFGGLRAAIEANIPPAEEA
ncbi:MAG: Uma2 family endonuclease [Fimbriimonadales bacterium]|nr:Uma2 family endonuclease [Fimbriimonadales bacterium]